MNLQVVNGTGTYRGCRRERAGSLLIDYKAPRPVPPAERTETRGHSSAPACPRTVVRLADSGDVTWDDIRRP